MDADLKERIYQIIKRRGSCDWQEVVDEIGDGVESYEVRLIMNELVYPDKRVVFCNRAWGNYWVPRDCDGHKYDYMFRKPDHFWWWPKRD